MGLMINFILLVEAKESLYSGQANFSGRHQDIEYLSKKSSNYTSIYALR